MLIPLHDHVLIRPVVSPPSTIIAAPDDHYEPEQMGVVIAIGSGMEARRDAVHRAIEAAIGRLASVFRPNAQRDILIGFLEDERDDYQPGHACAVGDMVCFSPKHGQELVVDGESYLILREDDLLAIVEPLTHEHIPPVSAEQSRRLLSPRDAGHELGLTTSGVIALARSGKLPELRDTSGRRFFDSTDVALAVKARRAAHAKRKRKT